MKLGLWHIAFLYTVIFLGISNFVEIPVNFLISPFLSSLLEETQSPNYTFSPEIAMPFVLRTVSLLLSIYLSTKIANMLLPIANTKKTALVATILYFLVSTLPSLRFLLFSSGQYDLAPGTNALLSAFGISSVFFVVFFVFSANWLKSKKPR